MKVFVDRNGCISCGVCMGLRPQVFAMGDDGKSTVISQDIYPEWEDAVKEAEESCPASVITIEY